MNPLLSLLAKGTVILALVSVVATQQDFNKFVTVEDTHKFNFIQTAHMGAIDDWNYTANGADWNFASCNSTSMPQSPKDMVHVNSTETPTPAL